MFLTDAKRAILRELREGPLDQYQLGATLGSPPFSVRMDLRGLKRERLVTDDMDWARNRLTWRLTRRGWDAAAALDQLPLDGVA